MSMYGSGRNIDLGKQESELAINIRKATSIGILQFLVASIGVLLIKLYQTRQRPRVRFQPADDLRCTYTCAGKHVRACIVYTWDHKSSQSFWAGMKVYVPLPS
jgi:hypothetical protein